MKNNIKRSAAIVLLLLFMVSLQLVFAEDPYLVYWAEPSTSMVPIFLYGPDYGTPEPRTYAIQFAATESFSQFILVLCGEGKFTLSIYEWYYNYDASLTDREPVWTTEFEVPGDKEYTIDCGTVQAGEYILLISNVEAPSYVGIYTIPEPDYNVETWNDFDSADIVCGGVIYDKKPAENYGTISGWEEVPDAETPEPTAGSTTQPATPTPVPAKTPDKTKDSAQSGRSGSNTVVYVIIAVAGAVIVVAIIFIIIKSKKEKS